MPRPATKPACAAKSRSRVPRRRSAARLCAYLDIETTGLEPEESELTVIGIGRDTGSSHEIIQLVGREITARALKQALRNVATIYTYNGERFDLPFIEVRLGLDLSRNYHHHDLMFDCWDLGLFGGFKRIEQKLGIPRRTAGIDGLMAVQLWFRYINDNDRNALRLLLRYNREDVINLQKLRYRLGV